MTEDKLHAVFFRAGQRADLAQELFAFRKKLFVDELGWDLKVDGDSERDQFDTPDAVHCALLRDRQVIGSFRAVRCDRPYLASAVFPGLATTCVYPQAWDCWEISRLGVRRQDRRLAGSLYAVMFAFGWRRQARALVALADLTYERFLHRMGIRTRRYGPPAEIGVDRQGSVLRAVAGEIPLTEQSAALTAQLHVLLTTVEITDETLVLGSRRISA